MSPFAPKSCLLAAASVLLAGATPPGQNEPAPLSDTGGDIAMRRDASDRMTVPAWIGESGPYPFLVDTGSERTMVSSELARILGLSARGPVDLATVSGRSRTDSFALDRFSFYKRQASSVRAPALAQRNIGAMGLIGLDSLQKMRVEFDFAGGRLRVLPARNRFFLDRSEIAVGAVQRQGRLILTEAIIEGRIVPMVVDTGASISIGNAKLFEVMMKRKPDRLRTNLTIVSVTGQPVPAQVGFARQMVLGNIGLRSVPIAFADAHTFDVLGLNDRPALLLGMNVLRHFDRVTIDFGARQVRFIPEGMGMRRSETRMAELNKWFPAG